jgi:hypothetical protein
MFVISATVLSMNLMLMSGETDMLLLSPGDAGALHSNGVHHVDVETGKVVTEWRFEKDGADICASVQYQFVCS